LLLIIILPFMPESPRYLAGLSHKESKEDLKKTLERVRCPDQIEHEMEELSMEAEQEKELGVATWRQVFVKGNKMRYRVLLGIGLQGFQVSETVPTTRPFLFRRFVVLLDCD
jgi:Sugar (and other) transporter